MDAAQKFDIVEFVRALIRSQVPAELHGSISIEVAEGHRAAPPEGKRILSSVHVVVGGNPNALRHVIGKEAVTIRAIQHLARKAGVVTESGFVTIEVA